LDGDAKTKFDGKTLSPAIFGTGHLTNVEIQLGVRFGVENPPCCCPYQILNPNLHQCVNNDIFDPMALYGEKRPARSTNQISISLGRPVVRPIVVR
jgi:hypothetical protein